MQTKMGDKAIVSGEELLAFNMGALPSTNPLLGRTGSPSDASSSIQLQHSCSPMALDSFLSFITYLIHAFLNGLLSTLLNCVFLNCIFSF